MGEVRPGFSYKLLVSSFSWNSGLPPTVSIIESLPTPHQPHEFGPPPQKKVFHFEEMWLSDSRCGKIVEAVWNSCATWDTRGSVISRVDRCGKDLAWWNKNVFGNVKRELEKKKKALLKAEREALHSGLNFRVHELQLEINILLDMEARMWNQ